MKTINVAEGVDVVYGVIYVFRNKINGKCYVGQSVEYKKRYRSHINSAKGGCKHPLYNAIRKYGIENFSYYFVFAHYLPVEVVGEVLDNEEKRWIKILDSYNNGYNCTLGGQGVGFRGQRAWNKGVPMTDEAKLNDSLGLKKYYETHYNPMKGKQYSEEKRKNMGRKKGCIPWNKGLTMNEEQRKNMGAGIKGKHRIYNEDGSYHF